MGIPSAGVFYASNTPGVTSWNNQYVRSRIMDLHHSKLICLNSFTVVQTHDQR